MRQVELLQDIAKGTEQFMQSALDALSAHIVILREDGTIVGVNQAWCLFADQNEFMVEQDYGVGMNYLAVCDASTGRNAKEAPLVAQGIRDVIAGKIEEFRLEYPCHAPTEKRWFVMHVTRFEHDGQVRVIVAHQNVTELKRVQIELDENQKRVQTILDTVINGILTLDTDGRIESINLAGAAIFGYDMLDMIGKSVMCLLAPKQRPNSMSVLLEQLQHGQELVGVRRNGAQFPAYFAINRVMIDDRRLYTGIVQDITDRRAIEAERIEKERLRIELQKERELRMLKNRFISMMSHELRTPLASIRLSSDLLGKYGDQAPPEEKQLYIDNISMQVELLTELIRDVSTISRSDSVSTTMIPERTDIVAYCRHLADEFRLTHHQTHTIIFSSQQTHIYAMIDHKLMRQVLSNLISNALKYTEPEGEVIVYVTDNGRYASVRVTDNGIGIPQEDLPHLFEPFHRASNALSRPGTGLGLAIAKQAIELHQGTIQVESAVGEGTSITVSLPLAWD